MKNEATKLFGNFFRLLILRSLTFLTRSQRNAYIVFSWSLRVTPSGRLSPFLGIGYSHLHFLFPAFIFWNSICEERPSSQFYAIICLSPFSRELQLKKPRFRPPNVIDANLILSLADARKNSLQMFYSFKGKPCSSFLTWAGRDAAVSVCQAAFRVWSILSSDVLLFRACRPFFITPWKGADGTQ